MKKYKFLFIKIKFPRKPDVTISILELEKAYNTNYCVKYKSKFLSIFSKLNKLNNLMLLKKKNFF